MRKIVLWIGILVIVAMAVYPPWQRTIDRTSIKKTVRLDYAPIFDPPEIDVGWGSYYGLYVDFARLSIQWGLVALITGALMWTLPSKRRLDK